MSLSTKGLVDFDQKSLAGKSLCPVLCVHKCAWLTYNVPFQSPPQQLRSIQYSGSKAVFSPSSGASQLTSTLQHCCATRYGISTEDPFGSSQIIYTSLTSRIEYHNKVLTRLFGGNRLYGCYFLALTIFLLGLFRDALYERALRAQPSHPLLETPSSNLIAYALIGAGNVLVLTSMWALGLTGTYLGDYFGILMDAKVTSFPFNITDAPMYYGSTMSFLGTAILYGKPAGILLTAEVLVVYLLALRFEDPFTAEIYAKRERQRAGGKKDS